MSSPSATSLERERDGLRFEKTNHGGLNAGISSTHLLLGAVLIATFAVYARALNFQFIYDDHQWLEQNPALHSWRYVGDYFTKHLWAGVAPNSPGNYYRPVFMLWSRLNVWIFAGNPMGYHLGAVLLHVLVTLLVFFLALQISSDRNHALLASLIFGLHPAHLESVAWILGATDPLAAAFTLASLLCWSRSRKATEASRGWRVASWVLFGLALLAKEIALIFPLLVIAHDYASRKERVEGAWRERLQRLRDSLPAAVPFVIMAVPYLVLRVLVLRGFSHPAVNALPWKSILWTWPELFWFYAKHLMLPVHLTTYYDISPVVNPGLENFVLPMLASVGIVLLLLCGAIKSKVIAMGAVWFVIPIIPAFDLRVFSREDLAHDRFLYMASIGFAVVVALLIQKVPAGRTRILKYPVLKGALTLVLAGGFGWLTVVQSTYFHDDWHFFSHGYAAAPKSLYAARALDAYWQGRGGFAESAKLLETVVKDHPDDWGATYDLGRDYYKLGRYPEAIRQFTKATLLDMSSPGPYLDLGLAWMQLGQNDRAEAAFREALRLRPDGYGYHFALGMVKRKQGDQPAALEQFKTELQLHPEDSAAKEQIAQINRGANRNAP